MATMNAAGWRVVTTGEGRGQAIEARAQELGIFSDREFERMTDRVGRRVPRASIRKAIDGEASDATYARIEGALDLIEEETQQAETALPAPEPHLIRITVEGVYGAKALIIEGAPEDQRQLEAMVDRIMRNLRNPDEMTDE